MFLYVFDIVLFHKLRIKVILKTFYDSCYNTKPILKYNFVCLSLTYFLTKDMTKIINMVRIRDYMLNYINYRLLLKYS